MKIERVRVGEVLRLQRRELKPDPAEEYRLIGVYSFGKGIFHREPKTGLDLGDYRFFRIEPGDLVLSNIQAWEGAIAHAGPRDSGVIGSHRFLSYVPVSNRIDANWARWFFLSEPGMQLIRQAAPGTVMRNRTLAIDRFEALEIPLPTIETQRRVAITLDRLADRQKRYAALCERSGQLRLGAADALTVRAANHVPELQFGHLFRLERRPILVDPAMTYQEIGIRSFGRGVFHKTAVSGADLGAKRVFQIEEGDLVISNVFGWEGAVAVASAAESGMIGSHRFMTWVPQRPKVDPAWVAMYLASPEGLERLRRASPGSAGRNRTLAVSRLQQVTVKVPRLDDQRRVVRLIENLRSASAIADRAEIVANAITPALMNHHFSGLS